MNRVPKSVTYATFLEQLEDLNMAVCRFLSIESWKTIITAVKLFNIQISEYEALLISAVKLFNIQTASNVKQFSYFLTGAICVMLQPFDDPMCFSIVIVSKYFWHFVF